jgi:hypothetical protein
MFLKFGTAELKREHYNARAALADRPLWKSAVYCPSWDFIIASICFFTASRLNDAGSCIGG